MDVAEVKSSPQQLNKLSKWPHDAICAVTGEDIRHVSGGSHLYLRRM